MRPWSRISDGARRIRYLHCYTENVAPRAPIQQLGGNGLLKNDDKNDNEGETVYPNNLGGTGTFTEAVFATRSDFAQFWDADPASGLLR